MHEEWVKLSPTNVPKGEYVVTELIQNVSGLKIILEGNKNIVEIFFDGIPRLLRDSDEGLRMRTWGEVQLKYNDTSFFRDCFFYEVKNSNLSKWIEEESGTFIRANELTHYCIVTSAELVDIVTTFEPTITMCENNNH
ncbi:MAG: hypothetical protein FWD05_02480 [Oscillospiraceae bacterium]|nr:hypothetical protein [Oscillospiraceae bacterium]